MFTDEQRVFYETCPQQYAFKYVLRVEVPEEPEPIHLFLGSRVHDALEYLNHAVARNYVPSLEEVLQHYRQVWDQAWSPRVQLLSGTDRPSSSVA